MKHMIIAAALACTLLCGCKDGGDKHSTAESTEPVAATTSVVSTSEKISTSVSTDAEKTTATKTATVTVQSGITESTSSADVPDIVMDDAPEADETKDEAEKSTSAENEKTPETTESIGNNNVLSDDGLDWTPLRLVE